MGFSTVIVVHNDQLHKAPEEIQLAARACASARPRRDELDFGWGRVISQAHADYAQITVVQGNTGRPLDDCAELDWMALDQLRAALERHGYKVSKRRKPRAGAT